MPSQHDVASPSTPLVSRPLYCIDSITPPKLVNKPINDLHVFYPHISSIDVERRMLHTFNDILVDGAAIMSNIRNSKLHFFEHIPAGIHVHKATAAHIKYFNNLPTHALFNP